MGHIQSPIIPAQILILLTSRNRPKEGTINSFYFSLPNLKD